MRRLLQANVLRWKKSKSLWFGMAAMAAYSVLICVMSHRSYLKYGVDPAGALEYHLFSGALLVGFVIADFGSMFVGTEYSDGTIRNKIVAGHARWAIYLANFLFCALSGVMFFLASALTAGAIGLALFGPAELSVSTLLLVAANGILMCTAFAALYNLIAMLIPNKAYTTAVNITMTIILVIAGSYLSSRLSEPQMYESYDLTADGELVSETVENPMYITGIQRDIYCFIVDVLPGGQAHQIGNLAVERPYQMLWCAAGEIIVYNAAGIWLFCRKDLK